MSMSNWTAARSGGAAHSRNPGFGEGTTERGQPQSLGLGPAPEPEPEPIFVCVFCLSVCVLLLACLLALIMGKGV